MNLLIAGLLLCSRLNMPADSVAPNASALIKSRLEAYQNALQQPNPILKIDDHLLNERQIIAQDIALSDTMLRYFCRDAGDQTPFRTEVMNIYPLHPSEYSAVPVCQDGSCLRVELYNYATNSTFISVVHMNRLTVAKSFYMKNMQPEVPRRLVNLAIRIAVESPEVEKALGFSPSKDSVLMASTKTALNRTRCERSKHLCVAPTFVKGDRALWVIVDLTDYKIAGLRWTNTGASVARQTERVIQNELMSECYCEKTNTVDQHGWKFNYILTPSDGLRISEVDYKGQRVIKNAKLVDWHVSYSNTDGFGYSDAVGCPLFSSSAVVAIEQPRLADIVENGQVTGFALVQNYVSEGWPMPCNYNYEQRYEFYFDGRFRSAVASLGRGCGNNGTYRPVTRIVFAGQHQRFEEWTAEGWKTWNKEAWQLQSPTTAFTPEGYQYRLFDAAQKTGYAVLANRGQFSDGGRGDDAYVYVTRQRADLDEGESDLITIGPCCNSDHRQGPERFMEPTPEALNTLQGDELVFWYVPQLKNDDRPGQEYCWAQTEVKDGLFTTKVFPCFSGAMLVPVKP
jgi:Copper amine oxidase, enzyme domain